MEMTVRVTSNNSYVAFLCSIFKLCVYCRELTVDNLWSPFFLSVESWMDRLRLSLRPN